MKLLKMKNTYLILVVSLMITGCFDLLDLSYWKDGSYRLSSNPGEPSCLSLTNDGIVLLDCVKSIGSNKEYIIAIEKNREKKVSYWIIKKKKNKFKEKPEGPFDLKEFDRIKKRLSIESLKFENKFGKD